MIKNLNDVLSLITLVIITIYGLGIFVNLFTNKNHNKNIYEEINIRDLIKNYIDNTEE